MNTVVENLLLKNHDFLLTPLLCAGFLRQFPFVQLTEESEDEIGENSR